MSRNSPSSRRYRWAASDRQSRRALSTTVASTASGSPAERPSDDSTSLAAANWSDSTTKLLSTRACSAASTVRESVGGPAATIGHLPPGRSALGGDLASLLLLEQTGNRPGDSARADLRPWRRTPPRP